MKMLSFVKNVEIFCYDNFLKFFNKNKFIVFLCCLKNNKRQQRKTTNYELNYCLKNVTIIHLKINSIICSATHKYNFVVLSTPNNEKTTI
jgi:hypothetical protein